MRVIEPPNDVLDDLKVRYGEPHRVYHTWAHVERLLALYQTYNGVVRDPTRVLWAIYWHDAIYDPAANDNEARSAALLRAQAAPYLPDARIVQIEKLILATAANEIPEGLGFDVTADCAAFLDFNLSILAAPEQDYDAYEDALRREHAALSDAQFAAMRKGALEGLLLRDPLFHSPMFRRLWDAKARANLRRGAARLGGGVVLG